MNYNKSLSELLFEETTAMPEDDLNKKENKDIVFTLTKCDDASYFLVPINKISELSSNIRQGASGIAKFRQLTSSENKNKDQNADTAQDVKDDTTASNVKGLDRGDKLINVPYNFIENKLSDKVAEIFQAAIKNGTKKGMSPLNILKQIQKPLIQSKYRFNFLNRTKEDTSEVTQADVDTFRKSGHAFLTLVSIDPTDSKKSVYYSNNDHIVVFAFPIVQKMNANQFKVHQILFNPTVKDQPEVQSESSWIHRKSLLSLLLESKSDSEGFAGDFDLNLIDEPEEEASSSTQEDESEEESKPDEKNKQPEEETSSSTQEDDEQISPQEKRAREFSKFGNNPATGGINYVIQLNNADDVLKHLEKENIPSTDEVKLDNIPRHLERLDFNVNKIYLVKYENGLFCIEICPKVGQNLMGPGINGIFRRNNVNGNKISKVISSAKIKINFLMSPGDFNFLSNSIMGDVYIARPGETFPENEQYPEYLTNLAQYNKNIPKEEEVEKEVEEEVEEEESAPEQQDDKDKDAPENELKSLDDIDPSIFIQDAIKTSNKQKDKEVSSESSPKAETKSDAEEKSADPKQNKDQQQTQAGKDLKQTITGEIEKLFSIPKDGKEHKFLISPRRGLYADAISKYDQDSNKIIVKIVDQKGKTLGKISSLEDKSYEKNELVDVLFDSMKRMENKNININFFVKKIKEKTPEESESTSEAEPEAEAEAEPKPYEHSIINSVALQKLGEYINQNNIQGYDESKFLDNQKESGVKYYLDNILRVHYKNKILDAVKNKSLEYELTFDFHAINSENPTQFVLTAKVNNSDNWIFTAKQDVKLFESFYHQNSLATLLFEADLSNDVKFIKKDSSMSADRLAGLLCYGVITKITSEEGQEEEKEEEKDEAESAEQEQEQEQEQQSGEFNKLEDVYGKATNAKEKFSVEIEITQNSDPNDSEDSKNKVLKGTLYLRKSDKKAVIEFNEQTVLKEEFFYSKGLRILLEKDNSLNEAVKIVPENPYDLDELEDLLKNNGWNFAAASVKSQTKKKKNKDPKAENFKKEINEILEKFNRKPGLQDVTYDNLPFEKTYEFLSQTPIDINTFNPKAISTKKVQEIVFNQIQRSEASQFLLYFIEHIFNVKFNKNPETFENFLIGEGDRLQGEEMFDELVDYFGLQDINLDKTKYFEENYNRQENILSESFLGSVGGFFGNQIGNLLGGAVLGVAGSTAGILLATYLGYKTKMHEKIPAFISKMYKKYKDKKAAEKAAIEFFANNTKLIDVTKTILSQIVAIAIKKYYEEQLNVDIGKLEKQSYDSIDAERTTGEEGEEGTEQTAEEVAKEVKEEAENETVKQAQSLLFTKSYRTSASKAAGRELSDDELLQDYEAKLNDIVMSFRQTVLANEANAVEAERSQLAYNNELNKKDAGVFLGVAAFPASIALTATLGVATGGVGLLAAGFIGSLVAGFSAEAISKATATKQGPKEREYLASAEKDKVSIRNIVIDLAKKELNIKESHGLSDRYIYLAGLSLLLEGLNEQEDEETEETESREKAKDTEDAPELDIRGKIDWTTISRKLTAGNFFLFNPTYTRSVGKQAAAEVQYDFGSSLAALTEDCFGLQITDVDKVDIRQAQAMSVTQMMVNQNAAMGQGSIRGAHTKGMSGKGMNDPIGMDEFGHLLNQADGDTAKVILYLMMNGRLDSFLNLLKGGQNTPESIFDFLGKVLEGEDLPKSMEASKQKAIENINSNEWIKELLKFGRIDSPITIIYDKSVNEKDLETLFDKIVEKIKEFSEGFDPSEAAKDKPKMNLDKHGCIISKTARIEDAPTSAYYRFRAETVGIRKIIDMYGRFISSKEDVSSQEDFLFKINVSGFPQVFTDFSFKYENVDNMDDTTESLASKLASLFVAKEMFSGQPGPSHEKLTITDKQDNISRKVYMSDLIKVFMNKQVNQETIEDTNTDEQKRIARQKNNAAYHNAFMNERVSSFYEEHLDLYRLWKSR